MKELLEQAKVLQKMIEEKMEGCKEGQQCSCKNYRVQLSDLNPGEVFTTDIGNFIVLEQKDGETKVITEGVIKEEQKYGSSTDYKESNICNLCDTEILQQFEEQFGIDNLIEHDVVLTTVDMQKKFGSIKAKVRPITFDEARQYNDLLVNKELPDWYWTCTAWSTPERGWPYSVAVVSPDGFIRNFDYDFSNAVRPVCILKSNIFVSRKENK